MSEDAPSTLREMSDEQLEATMNDATKALFRLRLQAQAERLDVPSELKRNRRLVARIKTIQNERRREGSQAVDQATGGTD